MQRLGFKYKGIRAYGSEALNQEINQALNDIRERFAKLNLREAGISEYNQRYLNEKFAKPLYEYSLIAHMLSYLLTNSATPRDRISLVDYGAGSGLICLVAKALGIGTVIYCDVYDVSCKDAETIGRLLGVKADHYITGDLSDVVQFMQACRMNCDILASNDCIEHIYDIETFISRISELPTQQMAIWLSSAANPLRAKTRRTLSKIALTAEYEDQQPRWGHKERDALRAFLSIRREIIKTQAPHLDSNEVEILARKTRGMKNNGIFEIVREYLAHGALPPDPDHPTNTCDPFTGNWAERLMDPFWIAGIARARGIHLDVKPGYWAHQPDNQMKDLAKTVTNACMAHVGNFALRLAPYYVLRGVHKPVQP